MPKIVKIRLHLLVIHGVYGKNYSDTNEDVFEKWPPAVTRVAGDEVLVQIAQRIHA